MKRYAIHAITGPVTALVFSSDSTSEVGAWLRRHGTGTPDLVVTDRQELVSTRLQRASR